MRVGLAAAGAVADAANAAAARPSAHATAGTSATAASSSATAAGPGATAAGPSAAAAARPCPEPPAAEAVLQELRAGLAAAWQAKPALVQVRG